MPYISFVPRLSCGEEEGEPGIDSGDLQTAHSAFIMSIDLIHD